jgi:error-prone DNA polymerase
MSLIRKQLLRDGVDSPNALHSKKHGDRVRVAGVVICRQRPATASGILFITLEDEVGFINLVVRKKEQASLRLPLFRSAILMVGGRLEKLEGTVHVLVQEAWQIEIPQDIAPTGRRSRIGR